MISIKDVYEYLKSKENSNYQCEPLQDKKLLELLSNPSDEFIKDFNLYETTHQFTGNQSIFYRLFQCVYWPDEEKPKWENFDIFFEVTKKLIKLASVEILKQEYTDTLWKFSLLTLTVKEYFIGLYKKNKLSNFENNKLYKNLQICWKKEIIDPLIKLGCDCDAGNGQWVTDSLLIACIREWFPDSAIVDLVDILIQRTKNINQPGVGGQTALSIAVIIGLPPKVIQSLRNQGAETDIIVNTSKANFQEMSLLNYFILAKAYTTNDPDYDYDRLSFLLTLGANLNYFPIEEKFDSLKIKQKTWLSPWQFAVAIDDEKALTMIEDFSIKNNIPLLAELAPLERKRDEVKYQNSQFKYQGTALELKCKARMFQLTQNLLVDIQQKYKIRCIVSNEVTNSNVSQVLTWLFETGPKTCARKFLQLGIKTLLAASVENPKFAIFVSTSLENIKKNATVEHDITVELSGLFDHNTGIHLKHKGERYYWTIPTIVHEIGHLVDHKLINLRNTFSPTACSFSDALKKDLSSMPENCDPWFRSKLYTMKLTESELLGSNVQEWFTNIFFEFPADFALAFPNKTEQDLFTVLNQNFPNTCEWYIKQAGLNIDQEYTSMSSLKL